MTKSRGIICLETEWEHTSDASRRDLNTRGLLEFIGKTLNCKIIHRTVATKAELQFYLNQFSKSDYKNNYNIIYFSFHGDTKSIWLEGENEPISLDELARLDNGNLFRDKIIHFSSCRTFIDGKANANLLSFKESVGAYMISGYTKSVNMCRSAINDIAFFSEVFNHPVRRADIMPSYNKLYDGLANSLGFKIL